jgi:hypothetical protein
VETHDISLLIEPRSKSSHSRQKIRPPLLPKPPRSRISNRNSRVPDSAHKLNSSENDQGIPLGELRGTLNFAEARVKYMSPSVFSNHLNTSYHFAPPYKVKRPASTLMHASRRSPEAHTSLMVEFTPENDDIQLKVEDLRSRVKASTSHGARKKRSVSQLS